MDSALERAEPDFRLVLTKTARVALFNLYPCIKSFTRGENWWYWTDKNYDLFRMSIFFLDLTLSSNVLNLYWRGLSEF